MSDEEKDFDAWKPVEDGFDFLLDQDSLADSLGAKLPNRSIYIVQGGVGTGKSLISQRMVFGLVENDAKVLVITTELTTRGWVEQMESIGYFITERIRSGQLIVLSRYGTIADTDPEVGLIDVITCDAASKADVIIIDTASSIMPFIESNSDRVNLIQQLRKITSQGRSIMLCIDPDEMDSQMVHNLRANSEVVLDMETTVIGGDIKRNIKVTRFLRAAGPIQTGIGWRVEPSMGFIVDITAVS